MWLGGGYLSEYATHCSPSIIFIILTSTRTCHNVSLGPTVDDLGDLDDLSVDDLNNEDDIYMWII